MCAIVSSNSLWPAFMTLISLFTSFWQAVSQLYPFSVLHSQMLVGLDVAYLTLLLQNRL
jgi:hypothetical protein